MNDMAKALGVGHQVEFEGKTYLMDGWSGRVIAGFEQWLKAEVWREVESDRPLVEQGILSPQLYAERHAAASKVVVGKEYRYGGPVFASSANTVEGKKEIIYLMLWWQDKNVTRELVDEMWQKIEVEMMARMLELMTDPNPQKGTLEATASPTSPSSPASSTPPMEPLPSTMSAS